MLFTLSFHQPWLTLSSQYSTSPQSTWNCTLIFLLFPNSSYHPGCQDAVIISTLLHILSRSQIWDQWFLSPSLGLCHKQQNLWSCREPALQHITSLYYFKTWTNFCSLPILKIFMLSWSQIWEQWFLSPGQIYQIFIVF